MLQADTHTHTMRQSICDPPGEVTGLPIWLHCPPALSVKVVLQEEYAQGATCLQRFHLSAKQERVSE